MTIDFVNEYFSAHPQGGLYSSFGESARQAAFSAALRLIAAGYGEAPEPDTAPVSCWAVAEETLHLLLHPQFLDCEPGPYPLASEEITGVSRRSYFPPDAADKTRFLSPQAQYYLNHALQWKREEEAAPLPLSRG